MMKNFAKTPLVFSAVMLLAWLGVVASVHATEVAHRGYLEGRYQYFFGIDPELEGFFKSIDPYFASRGFHPEQPHGGVLRTRSVIVLGFTESQSANFAVQAYWALGFFDRDQSAFGEFASLERASYTLSGERYDLTLGKQALTWGSGLLLNPTDLFYQSAPGDPWQERPGIWAIRHVLETTDTSSLTNVVALEDDMASAVGISRFEWSMETWDMAVQASWRQRGNLVSLGLDIKGDVEVGLWLETMVTYGIDADEWQLDGELGVDYTFDVLQGLYVAVEWLHSGAGTDEDYLFSLLGGGGDERSVFLGIDYMVALIRQSFSSDWSFSIVNMNNLRDPSGSLVGQLTWMTTGWMEIIVGGGWSYGDSDSEYGLALSESEMIPAPLWNARLTPEAFLSSWIRFYY